LSVCTVVVFPQSEDGWDRQMDEAAALGLGLALKRAIDRCRARVLPPLDSLKGDVLER